MSPELLRLWVPSMKRDGHWLRWGLGGATDGITPLFMLSKASRLAWRIAGYMEAVQSHSPWWLRKRSA